MLKGTNVSRVASSRNQNGRNMNDIVMSIKMDLKTPDKLAQFMQNAAEKLNFLGKLICIPETNSIQINFTGNCPMEALNLIFKLAPHMMGASNLQIVSADEDYKHKIKL